MQLPPAPDEGGVGRDTAVPPQPGGPPQSGGCARPLPVARGAAPPYLAGFCHAGKDQATQPRDSLGGPVPIPRGGGGPRLTRLRLAQRRRRPGVRLVGGEGRRNFPGSCCVGIRRAGIRWGRSMPEPMPIPWEGDAWLHASTIFADARTRRTRRTRRIHRRERRGRRGGSEGSRSPRALRSLR